MSQQRPPPPLPPCRRSELLSSASAAAPLPPLQVTRHNFEQVLPLVKQALADCQVGRAGCRRGLDDGAAARP